MDNSKINLELTTKEIELIVNILEEKSNSIREETYNNKDVYSKYLDINFLKERLNLKLEGKLKKYESQVK